MKPAIVAAILEKLTLEFTATQSAAHAAIQAATGDENKQENQYDTRGLEASYLAAAQTKRAAELETQISYYRALLAAPANSTNEVNLGTLVETEQASGRRAFYLLVPEGGGLSITYEGKPVNVITPHAPLGESLVGARIGETIDFENSGGVRRVRVVGVR